MSQKELKKTLKEYLDFKLTQYCRLTGFDYSQENAKAKLDNIFKNHMSDWIKEAVAAGC